jgi:hypothetical protein
MSRQDFDHIPYMLYADHKGRIYDHPFYRMAGFSGLHPRPFQGEDLILVPRFSKLFFIPDAGRQKRRDQDKVLCGSGFS